MRMPFGVEAGEFKFKCKSKFKYTLARGSLRQGHRIAERYSKI
jgi:hypothetical protein